MCLIVIKYKNVKFCLYCPKFIPCTGSHWYICRHSTGRATITQFSPLIIASLTLNSVSLPTQHVVPRLWHQLNYATRHTGPKKTSVLKFVLPTAPEPSTQTATTSKWQNGEGKEWQQELVGVHRLRVGNKWLRLRKLNHALQFNPWLTLCSLEWENSTTRRCAYKQDLV